MPDLQSVRPVVINQLHGEPGKGALLIFRFDTDDDMQVFLDKLYAAKFIADAGKS